MIAFAFLSRALIEAWQPFCMTLLIARRHWMTRCSPVEEAWFIVDGIDAWIVWEKLQIHRCSAYTVDKSRVKRRPGRKGKQFTFCFPRRFVVGSHARRISFPSRQIDRQYCRFIVYPTRVDHRFHAILARWNGQHPFVNYPISRSVSMIVEQTWFFS